MPAPRISTPAGFAPAFAIGFADPSARISQVSEATPLPVALVDGGGTGSGPTALEGQTAANLVAGPFLFAGLSPISVTLSGDWQGTVRLQRSTDGGATVHDLRVAGLDWGVFTANGAEQVWSESEAGVSFYLDIALTGGTCTYRVAQ